MWLKVIFLIVPLLNVKALDDFVETNRHVLHHLPVSYQNEGARYLKNQRTDGEMMELIEVQQEQASPKPTIIAPAPKPQPAPNEVIVIAAKQAEPAPNQVVVIPAAKPRLPKPVIVAPVPKPTLIYNHILKTLVQPVTNERLGVNAVNNQIFDFECQKANGYFATQEHCNRFVECKELKAHYYECPDGTNFNRDAVWPSNPCANSREVQCETSVVERVSRVRRECPSLNGLYESQDSDCSKYISCQGGVSTVMTCPVGLVFNPTIQSCDWLENVPSCRLDVFSGFTCPSFRDDDEDLISKYRYGQSCAEYIACHRGVPRLLKCDDELGFDEQLERCVAADNVENCI